MEASSILVISVVLAFLLCSTSFSQVSERSTIKNCTSHEECQRVCFDTPNNGLESLCDPGGTCVCDCHNTSAITASYTKACETQQPDGDVKDACNKYCTAEYQRPSRFCMDATTNSTFCTAVCKYISGKGVILLTDFEHPSHHAHHHISKRLT